MPFDNPILSVILPVFNCEKFVGQAIESILRQRFSDFELLIADDGSSDGSKGIIDNYARRDSRIKLLHNSGNIGKVSTANKLFELCKGEFVTVHDADDYSHPDRFQKQIDYLKDHPDVVMCGTSFVSINVNGEHFRDVYMPADFEEILDGILDASQFHGPTMVIRSVAVDGCLYRTFFNDYNEDCDLALRLVQKGQCANLRALLYSYRIVPNSLSKSITAEKKNYYRMAVTFYEQREMFGADDLMRGRTGEINARLQSLLGPYRRDPSLIHRENAAFLMYYRLYYNAVLDAWRACRLRPFRLVNWRTLQYCIRKSTLGI